MILITFLLVECLGNSIYYNDSFINEEELDDNLFECDGRTYCSDTKMNGDYDGIPCERQWCN